MRRRGLVGRPNDHRQMVEILATMLADRLAAAGARLAGVAAASIWSLQ